MTKNIEVFPVGTKVKIDDKIEAIVMAISISGLKSTIEYQCQWVTDKIQSQWVNEILIQSKEKINKTKIGFKK